MSDIILNLNGTTELPAGKLPVIETYLEMLQPTGQVVPARDDLEFSHWASPDVQEYRQLFKDVGEEWLWYTRLGMTQAELSDVLRDPNKFVYTPVRDGKRLGLFEYNLADPANAEISFFGLVPEAIGGGVGRWMMMSGLSLLWGLTDTKRVWLHTCTADSPQAILFYQSCGLVPFKRTIHVDDDPRGKGVIDKERGSRVPYLGAHG